METFVWIVTDSQVRAVFTELEGKTGAKAFFTDSREGQIRFREETPELIRVYIADDAVASYTISRHKVLK